MGKHKKKRVFWWVIILVLLAVLLGYVLKKELAHNHAVSKTQSTERQATQGSTAEKSLSETTSQEGMPKATPGQMEGMSSTPGSLQPGSLSSQKKKNVDYCTQLENDVKDFFAYLDTKPYVQHLDLGEPVLNHVKDMVKRLSAHPPIPAGEGIDPRILTRNIYHLYRTLGLKDIRLVKEILTNEKDSLEINLEIFYRWLMAGNRCPDGLGLRPSFEVVYKYAGFLINTIGGRACLYRRPNLARLLVTYYCILVVYEADIRGLNNYGIDIYPLVISLKNEISHYHDLEFQSDYLDKLTSIESYYIEKR